MSKYTTQPSDILELNQPGDDLLQRTDGFGIIDDDEVERGEEPLKPDRADSGISGSAGSTPEPELRLNLEPGEEKELEQHNLQQENCNLIEFVDSSPQPAKSSKKKFKLEAEQDYFSDVSPGGQESKSRLNPRIKEDDENNGFRRNEQEIR